MKTNEYANRLCARSTQITFAQDATARTCIWAHVHGSHCSIFHLLIPKPPLKSRLVRYKFAGCIYLLALWMCAHSTQHTEWKSLVCVAIDAKFTLAPCRVLCAVCCVLYSSHCMYNNPPSQCEAKDHCFVRCSHVHSWLLLLQPHLEAIPELINDEVKIIYLFLRAVYSVAGCEIPSVPLFVLFCFYFVLFYFISMHVLWMFFYVTSARTNFTIIRQYDGSRDENEAFDVNYNEK